MLLLSTSFSTALAAAGSLVIYLPTYPTPYEARRTLLTAAEFAVQLFSQSLNANGLHTVVDSAVTLIAIPVNIPANGLT